LRGIPGGVVLKPTPQELVFVYTPRGGPPHNFEGPRGSKKNRGFPLARYTPNGGHKNGGAINFRDTPNKAFWAALPIFGDNWFRPGRPKVWKKGVS